MLINQSINQLINQPINQASNFNQSIKQSTDQLKVPGPIASDFSQTFGDFGIRRKLIFFSLPLKNFTAEKCTVWKILMKM